MPVLHAVILGIVQGLTEALPISSSAHLVLIPWLFKWHYQGISFDIALHMGTAVAFGAYFFKDWVKIIGAAFIPQPVPPSGGTGGIPPHGFTKKTEHKSKMLWYIVIGTIPGALAGLILEKKAETVFRSPWVIAVMLLVFAVVLWLADHFGKKEKAMEKVSLKTSISIGLAQALAIIPGVSRSGITMTAGLFEGFSREAAAKFSFLLATPIVFAAAALKLPKLHSVELDAAFWAGVISSAVSGFLAIHFLLKFIKRSNLNIFVFYRIAFAIVILTLFIAH